jgi:hypothetical protein
VAIVFNIVVLVLAALAFLMALLFLTRAVQKRTTSHSPFAYGVARQRTRQSMQTDLLKTLGALLTALILVGVYLAQPPIFETMTAVETPAAPLTPDELIEEGTTEGTSAPTLTPTFTATPLLPVSPEATPTAPVTPTATPMPTDTPTPEPRQAVVDSPNGLWLRSEPGVDGEQIENLAHLSVVTVLDGFEEVDDLEWQEILAPSGNRGWVAASFLAYQD